MSPQASSIMVGGTIEVECRNTLDLFPNFSRSGHDLLHGQLEYLHSCSILLSPSFRFMSSYNSFHHSFLYTNALSLPSTFPILLFLQVWSVRPSIVWSGKCWRLSQHLRQKTPWAGGQSHHNDTEKIIPCTHTCNQSSLQKQPENGRIMQNVKG